MSDNAPLSVIELMKTCERFIQSLQDQGVNYAGVRITTINQVDTFVIQADEQDFELIPNVFESIQILAVPLSDVLGL